MAKNGIDRVANEASFAALVLAKYTFARHAKAIGKPFGAEISFVNRSLYAMHTHFLEAKPNHRTHCFGHVPVAPIRTGHHPPKFAATVLRDHSMDVERANKLIGIFKGDGKIPAFVFAKFTKDSLDHFTS